MISYGFKKQSELNFKETELKVTEELKKEGFGILSRIDVQEKFKEKLDIDFQKYLILGACNPPNAHKAILAEEDIGLMLPCNIIIYEKDNDTFVSMIKPTSAMGLINNEKLNEIARNVESKLKNVFDNI